MVHVLAKLQKDTFVYMCVCVCEAKKQIPSAHAFLFHYSPSGEIWSLPSETPTAFKLLIISTRKESNTHDVWHFSKRYWPWRVLCAQKRAAGWRQSKHYGGSYSLPTKSLAKTGNTLATRLHQLMWVSLRTTVHLECERESEKERD